MKERNIGWIIMFVGMIIIVITMLYVEWFDSKGAIGTGIGLFICLGIGLPLILIGSVMLKSAPEFILKRYNEVK